MPPPVPVSTFHPSVARWFATALGEPTPPQAAAWPAIGRGRHVLVAAPTGSGKTLAAFLWSLDELTRLGLAGELGERTRVVYVSPLKALSNDVERNLRQPLEGVRAELERDGLEAPRIRVQVRTGDTPAAARAAMRRQPPHVLVTTPESLYLLLTSESGRDMLGDVRTVIVDEIHALAGSKRGAHLALSLERLAALTAAPPVRIGLSATQKPIDEVARFLTGGTDAPAGAGPDGAAPECAGPGCEMVDTGHVRERDLAIELPDAPLEAVMSNETWELVYDRLTALIREHRTTLVFVNTRRLAERVARHLSERLGREAVSAHHGSLSRELRLTAEQRLKRGELRALVATASLELGIDIGDVELVCQLGSPRSIATLLQRVGRANHAVTGVPKGRLFPLSRDELVECAALLDAVGRGELDRLRIPMAPLDVLAQQLVAEVAAREWDEDSLYALVRRAHPYRDLARADFDAVVRTLADGYATRRGRRSAHLHRDAVNRRLRARRGARLTALTCGGAIPDNADYLVRLDPEDVVVGSVNEDFAIESMAGDVFQLGNASYRIRRIEPGALRVEDAHGAPPSIPFWLGEAPGRSDELSAAVSRLRADVDARLADAGRDAAGRTGYAPAAGTAAQVGTQTAGPAPEPEAPAGSPPEAGNPTAAVAAKHALDTGQEAVPASAGQGHCGGRAHAPAITDAARGGTVDWLQRRWHLPRPAAEQIVAHLAGARAMLGVVPTQRDVVLERFFDEGGGMQLVIHSPYGSRINRAWGLSLRKRFCRQFNFELQAAATEDAIVLSLGETHSFALDEVARYLNSATARHVLTQALLDAPLFGVRWRWNATVSLAMRRFRGGRRTPTPIQRIEAEDLLAVVFPDQIACLENIAGEREIPDHPLVAQTLRDCLEDAMDVDGFLRLLAALERGEVRVHARDLPQPSPLAQEILNARPYAFLDDAPLEERRTMAVMNRRWNDGADADDLGRLDPDAIARVREEAWPEAGSADELHDALMLLGCVTETEGRAGPWRAPFDSLVAAGRATRLRPADGEPLWVAAESLPMLAAVFPDASPAPALRVPEEFAERQWSRDGALVELLRGRLQGLGPVTAASLAGALGLPVADADAALAALEREGFVLRGRFADQGVEEWCERRLLARIHRYTLKRLRSEIEPVSVADFMRFLCDWQGLTRSERREGPETLLAALEQLEGFSAPAAAWETDLLPARVDDYDGGALDGLCLSGRILWARLSPPARPDGERRRAPSPVRSTPVAFLLRSHLPFWGRVAPTLDGDPAGLSPAARAVAAYLRAQGASFFDELAGGARLLPAQTEIAIGELVAAGRLSADSFAGLRALLLPSDRRRGIRGRRRRATPIAEAGRWALVHRQAPATAANTEAHLSRDFGGARDPAGPQRPAGARAPGQPTVPAPERDCATVEQAARLLLRRYGVIFRRLLEREGAWLPPWYEMLRVLRRMEARGELRGGRFVAGVSGEQYALPEAVAAMRTVRRRPKDGTLVSISAADPLNLVGVLTPGARVPALVGNRVLLRDGVAVAVRAGGSTQLLTEFQPHAEWHARNALLRTRAM